MSVPAGTPPQTAAQMTDSLDFLNEIESLVPEHYKAALEKEEQAEAPAQQVHAKTNGHQQHPALPNEFDLPTIPKTTKQAPAQQQQTVAPEEEEEIDPTTLDLLDSDKIDKLIEGDTEALFLTEEKEQSEEVPFWHEDEDYKQLTQKLTYAGVGSEDIDKIVRKVQEKSIVESATQRQTIETDLINLKKERETLTLQLNKLKELERAVMFDQMQETEEQYSKPQRVIVKEIEKMLKMEGSGLKYEDLLFAENAEKLNAALNDTSFDIPEIKKIRKHWLDFQEIEQSYRAAKNEAKGNINKLLKAEVPDNVRASIMKNALSNYIQNDSEEFKPIKEHFLGIKENESAAQAYVKADHTFTNIVKAFASAPEVVRDTKWLTALSQYVLDAEIKKESHAKALATAKENDILKTNLAKVAIEYRKLKKAAGGIQGHKAPGSFNGNHAKGNESNELLTTYKDFLEKKIDVDALLPEFK